MRPIRRFISRAYVDERAKLRPATMQALRNCSHYGKMIIITRIYKWDKRKEHR